MVFILTPIIVNWNLRQETLDCLQSLFTASKQADSVEFEQVVLVDNASNDDTADMVRQIYGAGSGVTVLQSPHNLGYGGALNLGICHALESESEWLLLLNNDVLFENTFFGILAAAVQAHQSYAIWSMRIEYHSARGKIWAMGDRRIFGTLLGIPVQHSYALTAIPPVLEVDFVTGCAMLVHRTVFEKIGLFDPFFFMYGEDVDFCMRATLAGFHCAVASQAVMYHKVSLSSNRDKPLNRYWRTYYQIRFYRKYATWPQRVLLTGYTFLRSVVLSVAALVHAEPHFVVSLARAWRDGWLTP